MTIPAITTDAWLTLAIVLALFASLSLTRIRTDAAFLYAIAALFVTGILDAKEAFGGFSSESVIVVAVLYIVIAGMTYTGVLNLIVRYLMGTPRTLSRAMVRLMLPVAALSSVLSNTTVVALFVNVVKIWSRKLNIPPSKLLIPLSYASCMGGVCTLVGTPPNLIISGLYTDATGTPLSILTPTVSGLFCLAAGIMTLVIMQRLLPVRQSPLDNAAAEDYTAELSIASDNPNIGMTYSEAGILKPADGTAETVTPLAVKRFDNIIETDDIPGSFVMGGDRLIVTGSTDSIISLCRRYGLRNEYLSGVMASEGLPKGVRGAVAAMIVMVAMVALSACGVMSLLQACVIAAIAVTALRLCSISQAMDSIDFNILIVFAGSVCIGKAVESTGLADLLAQNLLAVCGPNPIIVLTAICLVGTFVTEFISNTAAGAMFFPIAMSAAQSLGANPLTFCVALMVSVSSSFATPIGSPTHMLVYVPGGYRFSDFARIGIVMNLVILAANIFITTLVFPM